MRYRHSYLPLSLFMVILGYCHSQSLDVNDIYNGCGSTKGCYIHPAECAGDGCQFVITYTQTSEHTDFEVLALKDANAGNDQYVAMGIADEPMMSGANVVACILFGGTVNVQQSQNTGYSNAVPAVQTGLEQSESGGAENDDRISCNFRRLNAIENDAGFKDISAGNSYHILISQGAATSTTNKRKHVFRLPSSDKVDFSELTTTGGVTLDPMYKAHGILMVLAWGFLAGLGIINARYYKPNWPGKTLFGTAIWFNNHRFAMVLAFLFTVISFIIIFVKVEGLSDLSGNVPTLLTWHPYLGITVTALALTNPIMALFRPGKEAPKRWLFNWGHRIVGETAFILGYLNILLGMNLSQTGAIASETTFWLMVAYGIIHLLVEVLLFVRTLCSKRSAESHMEMTADGKSDLNQESPEKSGLFERIILYVYTIVSLAIVLTVVISMGLA